MTTVTEHQDGLPCWVDVMVENDEQHHELRAFLTALFDWTWALGTSETSHYAIAHHDGAPVMGLGHHEGSNGQMVTYFATSDVAASLDQATQLGATAATPVMSVMDLGKMVVLTDPTGALFGLWQAGSFHGFGVQHEENSFGWCDQTSADPEAASAFYASLSGTQLAPVEPPMRVLQRGEQWYASFSSLAEHEQPSWQPIFVVDSLARVRETVPRHGGTILVESMPVPGSALCMFSEPVNGTRMTVMQGGEQPS